jgi:uncharacterized protein (DUF924 family)
VETSASICHFWFGDHTDDAVTASEHGKLWWSKQPEVDAQIRARFEATLQQTAAGANDDWSATPHGTLALILLTDQFPRNMYRESPQSFAFDDIARGHALAGIARGDDQALRPIERVFFYLPFEHGESLEHQDRAMALFTGLFESAAEPQKDLFRGFLNFAERHHRIIARFGRFPHRNAILGRSSTADEIAFLQEPGSSF